MSWECHCENAVADGRTTHPGAYSFCPFCGRHRREMAVHELPWNTDPAASGSRQRLLPPDTGGYDVVAYEKAPHSWGVHFRGAFVARGSESTLFEAQAVAVAAMERHRAGRT
jgi:hypothetical protein